MLSSTIIFSVLASSALGVVVPQTEDANLVKRFDVPGASQELGFTIPEGTPNGAYSVYIDSDGVAHHTRLELPEGLESPNEEDEGTLSSGLVERQGWEVTCQGRALSRTDTDFTVRTLRATCGDRAALDSGSHFYVISNYVATYFCNNSPVAVYCTAELIIQQLQENVSRTCGAYRAGWSRWPTRIYIGSEYVNANYAFCGRNH